MRSLGDLAWINDYVGIPYKHGGRDWEGLDCYGLVKLVYQEEYGIVLRDWATEAMEMRGKMDAISSVLFSGEWEEVEEPDDGCFAVCKRLRAAHHLGLYYGGGVLHAVEGTGVIYQPMGRFMANFNKVTFGRWTP